MIECSYRQVYLEKVRKKKPVSSAYHYVNNISGAFKQDKQNKSETCTHTMTLSVSRFKKKRFQILRN